MRRAARWLVPAGAVAVVLSLAQWHASHIGHYEFAGSSRFAWSLTYAALLAVAAYAAGLPDLATSGRTAVLAAVSASVAAAVGISLVQLVLGSQLLPRFVVGGTVLLAVPWFLACSVVANGGRKQERWRDRVVAVVGSEEEAALRTDLDRQPERSAHLVGVLPPDEARPAAPWAEPLVDRAITLGATVVVLDRRAAADAAVVAQAATLHEAGLRVRTLSLFYEEWLGKLPLSELEQLSLMFDISELHRARYGRVKRVIDVSVGLVGAVVLVALLPVVVLLDLAANRGPVFYRQQRVGRDRAVFTMYKLRTMRPGGASTWTTPDDPRITPGGRLLRRTHLDELPQAINMLKGDLSLIGPRPEQPQYVEELARKVPWYHVRHLVRPGLTGWAQVKYDYGATEEDAMEKLQYELYYLRRQSLGLDLRIAGRTLRHVVGLGGR